MRIVFYFINVVSILILLQYGESLFTHLSKIRLQKYLTLQRVRTYRTVKRFGCCCSQLKLQYVPFRETTTEVDSGTNTINDGIYHTTKSSGHDQHNNNDIYRYQPVVVDLEEKQSSSYSGTVPKIGEPWKPESQSLYTDLRHEVWQPPPPSPPTLSPSLHTQTLEPVDQSWTKSRSEVFPGTTYLSSTDTLTSESTSSNNVYDEFGNVQWLQQPQSQQNDIPKITYQTLSSPYGIPFMDIPYTDPTLYSFDNVPGSYAGTETSTSPPPTTMKSNDALLTRGYATMDHETRLPSQLDSVTNLIESTNLIAGNDFPNNNKLIQNLNDNEIIKPKPIPKIQTIEDWYRESDHEDDPTTKPIPNKIQTIEDWYRDSDMDVSIGSLNDNVAPTITNQGIQSTTDIPYDKEIVSMEQQQQETTTNPSTTTTAAATTTSTDLIDIRLHVGIAKHRRNDIIGAIEEFQKAYNMLINDTTDHAARIASILNSIGSMQYQIQDYYCALHSFQQALTIHETLLLIDSAVTNQQQQHLLETAGIYYNIGITIKQIGTVDESAIEYCRKALQIRQQILGQLHEDTAISHYILAELLLEMNELDDSMEQYQQFLMIQQQQQQQQTPPSNDGHIDDNDNSNNGDSLDTVVLVTSTIIQIGTIYQKQGLFDIALVHYHNALEQLVQQYGPTHIQITECLTKIGEIHCIKYEWDLALMNYIEVSKIINENHNTNPDPTSVSSLLPVRLAQTVATIGTILYRKGQYDNAVVEYQKAQEMFEKTRSNETSSSSSSTLSLFDVGSLYNNIGQAMAAQRKYPESITSYLAARDIFTNIIVNNKDTTNDTKRNHQHIQQQQHHCDHNSNHTIGICNFNIALSYMKMNDIENAMIYFLESYDQFVLTYGTNHPQTTAAKYYLSKLVPISKTLTTTTPIGSSSTTSVAVGSTNHYNNNYINNNKQNQNQQEEIAVVETGPKVVMETNPDCPFSNTIQIKLV